MNALNLDMVNLHAEYPVFLSQTGKYVFKTNFDILYAVDFELDSNPYYTAYWFNLTNPEHAKSPGDVKIAQTVVCIIEEFFRLNPEVLLYMCKAGEFLYKNAFQTIAFNLAKNKVATAFIFDNVKFEVEESIVSSLTKDPAVDPKPYPVGIKTVNASKEDGLYYDLQGRRVATPAKGLYIVNGKKIMVK